MSRKKVASSTAPDSEPKKRRRRGGEEPSVQQVPTEPRQEPLPEPPVRDAALVEAERRLIERYPEVNIEVGSLLAAGERPEFSSKRTVIIRCSSCNRERILATSDLFHTRHCRDCKMSRKGSSQTTQ